MSYKISEQLRKDRLLISLVHVKSRDNRWSGYSVADFYFKFRALTDDLFSRGSKLTADQLLGEVFNAGVRAFKQPEITKDVENCLRPFFRWAYERKLPNEAAPHVVFFWHALEQWIEVMQNEGRDGDKDIEGAFRRQLEWYNMHGMRYERGALEPSQLLYPVQPIEMVLPSIPLASGLRLGYMPTPKELCDLLDHILTDGDRYALAVYLRLPKNVPEKRVMVKEEKKTKKKRGWW